MIKIDKTDVMNFDNALRGMRNPLNSWDKSDSSLKIYEDEDCYEYVFQLGDEDMKLCKRLIRGGTEHRKFLRQIFVSADIIAPRYWWIEFDTYKIGTTCNSCSTMHTIHKKLFEKEDFSVEHLTYIEVPTDYNDEIANDYNDTIEGLIWELNLARNFYLKTKDKKYWWQIIQLLPQSYNQKRTVTMNYEVLINMYHQRHNHKLDEWNDFCKWIEDLPYMKEFLDID